MSCNLLVDIITPTTQLVVNDETHHLTGVVGKEDVGEGKTRRLMMQAVDLQVKRLSLTFTPRIIRNDNGLDADYLTMDDTNIFGRQIAELKIRDLITKGVLPDYRVWSLRDASKKGLGILGKADCILEAWEATEVVRGEEMHILHHLIVFASTNDEAKQLEMYFSKNTNDTLVLCVKGGDHLQWPIRAFSEAKRAIIVNCKVLGEGVDIPIANAVAVMYPKHSRCEITQMILRAGRWYENKPVFHILLPILDSDDMSGFEEVLTSLASCDEQLRDEILISASNAAVPATADPSGTVVDSSGSCNGLPTKCIMIDDFDGSNVEEIQRCFANIRQSLFPSIQGICVEKHIDTSVEYATTLCLQIPELPQDPKPKNKTWFDYLHPTYGRERVTVRTFVQEILAPNNLRVGHKYDEWLMVQPSDVRQNLPSMQHISDGYFGSNDTNFNELHLKWDKKDHCGRR